jgi:hypothetical protein
MTLLLAILLAGSACRRRATGEGEGASGTPIAASGPQVLAFRGNAYNVIATYFLRFPEGLQFTIEYQVPAGVDIIGMTDEQAYEAAYPVMRGALEQGWHRRAKVEGIDGPTVSRIGMVLYADESRARARRLARDIKVVETGP